MSDFNVWSYLAKLGVTAKGPGHPDLKDGDQITGIERPILLQIEDIEELLHVDYKKFSCQVPGCKATFSQLLESETHYNAAHRHSCSVCKRSLPTPHLLELHLQEQHDSFFSVLSERKPSYQCLLPTCPTLSWTSQERHDHVIKSHKFPPDFRFDQVKKRPRGKKVNEAKSVVRPVSLARLGDKQLDENMDSNKRSSVCGMDSQPYFPDNGPLARSQWTGTTPDISTTGISHSPKSGKKSKIPVLRSNSCRVPRNLSFGAGVTRTFVRPRSKHWHQTDHTNKTTIDMEDVDMDQLHKALPNL